MLHGHNLLPGNAALFFQGTTRTAGGAGVVFGDGLRCVGGSTRRLQIRIPGPTGAAATTFPLAGAGGATPGLTLYYQVWYRDSLSTPCGGGFNLSNGLELTWEP